MVWFKPKDNEFLFKLKNLDVQDEYVLWSNNTPYREAVNGISPQQAYFMKPEEFTRVLPGYRKGRTHVRSILVDNAEYQFGLKKTANDQIVQEIINISKIGKNPLNYFFKYRKTGTGISTTHVVVVMHEDMHTTPELQISTPSATLVLTENEMQILGLFQKHQEYFSETQFQQVFNATMSKYFNSAVMPDRIGEIYNNFYKRK